MKAYFHPISVIAEVYTGVWGGLEKKKKAPRLFTSLGEPFFIRLFTIFISFVIGLFPLFFMCGENSYCEIVTMSTCVAVR